MDSPRTHLPIALAVFLTFVCPLLNGSMNFTEVAQEKNAGNPLIMHGENVPGENSPILRSIWSIQKNLRGVAR